MKKLIIETIVVGILMVVMGTVVSYVFFNQTGSNKDWNKNHAMEIALFLTGVFAHLFCEFTGINRWYCKHGNACQR